MPDITVNYDANIHPTGPGQMVRAITREAKEFYPEPMRVKNFMHIRGVPCVRFEANDIWFEATHFAQVNVQLETYAEVVRAELAMKLARASLNSTFGKLGHPFATGGCVGAEARIPNLFPGNKFDFRIDYFGSEKESSMSIIPPLEVPAAPVEPEPVVEPESASVQMLRKIVDDRRKQLDAAEATKAHNVDEIEYYKTLIARHEAAVAASDRHIAAAQASIDETLADIAKLGGRPEPTPEA